MRANMMKPNAKRINNQSLKSILKMMAKLTSTGDIKVANKYFNRNFVPVSVNNTNYTEEILYWKCQSCGYRLPHKLYEQSKMDYGCPTCGNSYAYFTSVVK